MNRLPEKANKYDNVVLDIDELFRTLDETQSRRSPEGRAPRKLPATGIFGSLIKRYVSGLTYALGIRRRLLYADLILDWFLEFQDYWVNYLGNRPISVQDFHYLRGEYRKRFPYIRLDGDSESDLLKVWQDPRNIYSVFGSVWNTAFTDLISYKYAKYVGRHSLVCEYGCGIAPITHSFLKYYPGKRLRFTIADIPQFTFHFAKWRFRNENSVRAVTVDPLRKDPLPQEEIYDVIFICQVFEHLLKPLETAQVLYERLRPGGILVFDYLESEAEGLDTRAGVEQREDTLRFIRDHFTPVQGSLKPDRVVGTVIAMKIEAGEKNENLDTKIGVVK